MGVARRPAPGSLIENSGELIKVRFAHEPELQAELYGVVGGVFADMGAYRLAADYASRRTELLANLRASRAEQASSLLALAESKFDDTQWAGAEAAARQALALSETPQRVDALVLLARIEMVLGRPSEAADLLAQLAPILVAAKDAFPLARIRVRALQARLLLLKTRQDEAVQAFEQAIEEALKLQGRLSLEAISIRLELAELLVSSSPEEEKAKRNFDAATAALQELGGAHAVRAAVYAADFAMDWYLHADADSGWVPQALESSHAILLATPFQIPAWFLSQVEFTIGEYKRVRGDIIGARALLEPNAATIRDLLPMQRGRVANSLGILYKVLGRHELAVQQFREQLELRRQRGRGNHPYAANDYRNIARTLAMAGRFDEAIAVLDSAPHYGDVPINGLAPDRYNHWLVWARAAVHLGRGEAATAVRLLESSPRAVASGDADTFLPVYGEALCAFGRHSEGLAALREQLAADERKSRYLPQNPVQARLRAVAGLCELKNGDRAAALQSAAFARAAFIAQPEVSAYYKAPSIALDAALRLRAARTRAASPSL